MNIKIIGPAAGPVPTQMHPSSLFNVTAVMTNEQMSAWTQLAYVSALLSEADIVCTKRRSSSI